MNDGWNMESVFCVCLIAEARFPKCEVSAEYHNIPWCLSKLLQIQDINSPPLPQIILVCLLRDANLSSSHPIRSKHYVSGPIRESRSHQFSCHQTSHHVNINLG